MGPVLLKELIEIARRKRYFVNRVLYGSALLVTLFFVWEENRYALRSGGIGQIRALANLGEEFYIAFSLVQYSAVWLFVPLFLAGVVSSEREERTLELLFTTTLTDREIILGKLVSRVAVMVMVILAGMPVMSLILLFGGIDPEALLRVLAATLLAILYTGAHAICFSTTSKGPLGALVRTYWWMAVWILAVPIAVVLPLAATTPAPTHPVALFFLTGLLFTNPVGPLFITLVGEPYEVMARHLGQWFFPFTFVMPALWSFFLIHRAVKRVRFDPIPFGRWRKWVPGWRTVAAG